MPKVVVTEAELKQIIKTVLSEQDAVLSSDQIADPSGNQIAIDEFQSPTAQSKIKLIGILTDNSNINNWLTRLIGITYADISNFIAGTPGKQSIQIGNPSPAVQEFLNTCIYKLLMGQSVTQIPINGVKSISQQGRDLASKAKIFSIDINDRHYSDNDDLRQTMADMNFNVAQIVAGNDNFFQTFVQSGSRDLARICVGLKLIPSTNDKLFYCDQAAEQKAASWLGGQLAPANSKLKNITEKYNAASYKNFLYQPLRAPLVWRTVSDEQSSLYNPWRMTWTACNLFLRGLKEDGLLGLVAMHKSLLAYSGQDYKTVYQAGSSEALRENLMLARVCESRVLLTRSELSRIISASLLINEASLIQRVTSFFGDAGSLAKSTELSRNLRSALELLSDALSSSTRSFTDIAKIANFSKLQTAFPLKNVEIYDAIESFALTSFINSRTKLFDLSRLSAPVSDVFDSIVKLSFSSTAGIVDSERLGSIIKEIDKLTPDEKRQLSEIQRFLTPAEFDKAVKSSIQIDQQWQTTLGDALNSEIGVDITRLLPNGKFELNAAGSSYTWPDDVKNIEVALGRDKFNELKAALTFELASLIEMNRQILADLNSRIFKPITEIALQTGGQRADELAHAFKSVRAIDVVDSYIGATQTWRQGLAFFQSKIDGLISALDIRTPNGIFNVINLVAGNPGPFYARRVGKTVARLAPGSAGRVLSAAGAVPGLKAAGEYGLGTLTTWAIVMGLTEGYMLTQEAGIDHPKIRLLQHIAKPTLYLGRRVAGDTDPSSWFEWDNITWGLWGKLREEIADYKFPAISIPKGGEQQAINDAIEDFGNAFKSLAVMGIDENNDALMSQFKLVSQDESLLQDVIDNVLDATDDLMRILRNLGDVPIGNASSQIEAATAAARKTIQSNAGQNQEEQSSVILTSLQATRMENIQSVIESLTSISPGPLPVFTKVEESISNININKNESIQEIDRVPSTEAAGGDLFMSSWRRAFADAFDVERNVITGILMSPLRTSNIDDISNPAYYMETCFPETNEKLREQLKSMADVNPAKASEEGERCFKSIGEAWREIGSAYASLPLPPPTTK